MIDWKAELSELFREESEGRLFGRSLIEQCTAMAFRFQRDEVAGVLPHFVWHYLSDADIRSKDAVYRRMQLEQIAKILGDRSAPQG